MKLKYFISHHIILIVILAISIIFAAQALAFEYANNYLLDDVTPKETTILSKVSNQDEQLHDINDQLVDVVNDYTQNVAVGYLDLSSQQSVIINPNSVMPLASIYKLFVAYEVESQISAGEISPDLMISTAEGNDTVSNCLRLSIVISDNSCGRALRQLIAGDVTTPASLSLLYPSLNLTGDYPESNVQDVMNLLENIYDQKDFDSTQLVEHLENQTISNKLASGQFDGKLAHKTGELEDIANDAGILFGDNGDKVIVVLSNQWSNPLEDSPELFQRIMAIVD